MAMTDFLAFYFLSVCLSVFLSHSEGIILCIRDLMTIDLICMRARRWMISSAYVDVATLNRADRFCMRVNSMDP